MIALTKPRGIREEILPGAAPSSGPTLIADIKLTPYSGYQTHHRAG